MGRERTPLTRFDENESRWRTLNGVDLRKVHSLSLPHSMRRGAGNASVHAIESNPAGSSCGSLVFLRRRERMHTALP
jgi:hypothetical protein